MRRSSIATIQRSDAEEARSVREHDYKLTERERRRAHRLIHRCQRGLRTKTDALIGWMDLSLGTK